MPKRPGKVHMHDMVKIDITVFEIVGGGRAFNHPPPPRNVSFKQNNLLTVINICNNPCVLIDGLRKKSTDNDKHT